MTNLQWNCSFLLGTQKNLVAYYERSVLHFKWQGFWACFRSAHNGGIPAEGAQLTMAYAHALWQSLDHTSRAFQAKHHGLAPLSTSARLQLACLLNVLCHPHFISHVD
jgi:hypothetical protein